MEKYVGKSIELELKSNCDKMKIAQKHIEWYSSPSMLKIKLDVLLLLENKWWGISHKYPLLTLVAFHGLRHFILNKLSSRNNSPLCVDNRDQVVHRNICPTAFFFFFMKTIPFATTLDVNVEGGVIHIWTPAQSLNYSLTHYVLY